MYQFLIIAYLFTLDNNNKSHAERSDEDVYSVPVSDIVEDPEIDETTDLETAEDSIGDNIDETSGESPVEEEEETHVLRRSTRRTAGFHSK